MMFVDIFDVVRELRPRQHKFESLVMYPVTEQTLNTVLSIRLKNSKVVPKSEVTVAPVLASVLFESSTYKNGELHVETSK